jgi:hypothetical protein
MLSAESGYHFLPKAIAKGDESRLKKVNDPHAEENINAKP